MRLPFLSPSLLVLVPWLALTACGQNTDTSVSETATATTTGGSTGPTSVGTGDDTGTGGLTGGLTGTGGDDASASGTTTGATGGGSTGPGSDTSSGATLETTTLTTGEPQTTGASTGAGESTGQTTDDTNGQIDDCQELAAAFASEALEIRSCTAADECGQELKGTSCGCTHNWVARTDADTDHFFELLGMADRLGCELILAGTCDCPAADGFTCTDGICAWNYL